MKTIVVGYDESEASGHALERAADFATVLGSRLIVTSVSPVVIGAGQNMVGFDPVNSPDDVREDLRHANSILATRNLTAELVPAVGEPASAILELAEVEGADLSVVGTNQRSFLERLLGQSVSSAVSRRAGRDVLIVQ